MTKKTVVIYVVVFLSSLISGVLCSASEVLTGRVGDWPPYYFKESGAWKGITVDAYQALITEAGVVMEMKAIPWSRALKYIKTKPVMMSNLTPTEERKKFMHFFGPHHTETMGIVISVKYKELSINTLDELVGLIDKTGKKVIYQQDVFYSKEFNSRLESDPDFAGHFKKKVVNMNDSILLVANGNYLGFFEDIHGLNYQIKLKKVQNKVVVHDFVLNKTDVYIGVSKSISRELYDKLKKADDVLNKNGTYIRIQKKWLPH